MLCGVIVECVRCVECLICMFVGYESCVCGIGGMYKCVSVGCVIVLICPFLHPDSFSSLYSLDLLK